VEANGQPKQKKKKGVVRSVKAGFLSIEEHNMDMPPPPPFSCHWFEDVDRTAKSQR